MKFRAPLALGRAIQKVKTPKRLKPLLEAYRLIYGHLPGEEKK